MDGTQCDDFGVRKGYVGICSVQAVYGIGFRCVADEFHAVERQFDVIALPVTESCGLNRDSIILLEQVRTLDKKRLRERMGHVEEEVMEKVDTAIAVSFGLPHDQLV